MATTFYIKNFDLKKAFQIFDSNGDGFISRQEFRLGLNSLDIGLSYDEIDDLMRSMSTHASGQISYDDFITQMDANIRHRRGLLTENVNEAVFMKINDCLEYIGEPLREALSRSDFDHSGTILLPDLIRVMKRIGLSNVEPHLPLILSTGGATLQNERIDIESFAQKLTSEVKKRVKSKN